MPLFSNSLQYTKGNSGPNPDYKNVAGDPYSIPGNPNANIPTVADFPDPGTAGTPIGGGAPGSGLPTTPPPGTMKGDASDFLRALYASRPAFAVQQQEMLTQLGPGLRDAAFAASPELAAVSQYLMSSFQDPFGGMLSTYQDAIRGAQAARGFGGGGTGLTGEEGRYLTGFAEKRRQEMLPQLQAFGNNLLSIGGLQAPPDITLASIGGLALQNRLQQDTKAAGEAQSDWAKQIYEDYLKSNPFQSSGMPGTAGPTPTQTVTGKPAGNLYGQGGSTSILVGNSNWGDTSGQDWYSQNASKDAGYGGYSYPFSGGGTGGASASPNVGAPAPTGYAGPYFNSNGDLVNSEGVAYNIPTSGDSFADEYNKKAAADYAAGAASGVITPQYADWAIQHLGLSTF